ncbi:MAG: cytochrome d ubiquinol oxidase subunit II [Ktedonobacterales bacterium]
MWLNVVWFVLFGFIIAGYLVLDGFDLGCGILHPFIARDDTERRVVLNSIGPVWDGNEVWLVLGGGVLFAAFPLVYASLFSGLYLAFFLVLLCIILRAVAIEFRGQRGDERWHSLWDYIFFLASLLLALLLGVALGNIILGLPVDANGNISVSLIQLLSPFALLVGATTISMFAMHGAIYLTMKTDGELNQRIHRWLPRLMIAFFILNTLVVVGTLLLHLQVTKRYLNEIWPVIFPALALGALILSWYLLRRDHSFSAFVASGAVIVLLIGSVAAGIYPNLLLSTINPAYDLTIFNSASGPNTLTVMLIFAVIGIPIVLLYTAGVYYIFQGKVRLERESY